MHNKMLNEVAMYKNLDDFELINRILSGDNDAFSEIVTRYKNLVYSVILRMINDYEEANDISQEVFIKVYKNLSKYQPEFKFSTWIMRITTNHVIDYLRKRKQETVNIEDVDYELSSSSNPEREYLEKEQSEIFAKAIGKLPEMYKLPIVLYHIKRFSYQEIADMLNIPLSKVKNRIFRGRRLLKDILEGMEEV